MRSGTPKADARTNKAKHMEEMAAKYKAAQERITALEQERAAFRVSASVPPAPPAPGYRFQRDAPPTQVKESVAASTDPHGMGRDQGPEEMFVGYYDRDDAKRSKMMRVGASTDLEMQKRINEKEGLIQYGTQRVGASVALKVPKSQFEMDPRVRENIERVFASVVPTFCPKPLHSPDSHSAYRYGFGPTICASLGVAMGDFMRDDLQANVRFYQPKSKRLIHGLNQAWANGREREVGRREVEAPNRPTA